MRISFGRQKDGQALDVLLQGSIESYHFIPNLTTRHPEGFSVDALIGRTAHLQVLSGSLHIRELDRPKTGIRTPVRLQCRSRMR